MTVKIIIAIIVIVLSAISSVIRMLDANEFITALRHIGSVFIKLLVFGLLLSIIVSCSKVDTNELINTTWSGDNITLNFYENEGLNYTDDTSKWIGVYKYYSDGSLLLYKAVPGLEHMPLIFTGTVIQDDMTLEDANKISYKLVKKN